MSSETCQCKAQTLYERVRVQGWRLCVAGQPFFQVSTSWFAALAIKSKMVGELQRASIIAGSIPQVHSSRPGSIEGFVHCLQASRPARRRLRERRARKAASNRGRCQPRATLQHAKPFDVQCDFPLLFGGRLHESPHGTPAAFAAHGCRDRALSYASLIPNLKPGSTEAVRENAEAMSQGHSSGEIGITSA